ncbi:MAG TPA: MFS transporter [Candidatus Acidoferrales bacterium]|nr:MFS transporter [Candidatus Acidoferrales bacterium]
MNPQDPPPRPRGDERAFLSPLRHRDFRVFWSGLLASGIGSQFTSVAMAWQIYELTNSAFQIGLLGLARFVPQILLLLVGGLLADAINRRKLMMCTQSGLVVVSTALALLTVTGNASPPLLYGASMLLAFFSSLETPSRQAIVPSLVPPQDLPRALALHSSQRYVSVIVGPSLAGLVLAFSGAAACYAIDALSWLVMLWALAMLRAPLREGGGWKAVSFASLREGLRFVYRHPVMFPLMLLDFGATFFGSVRALLPVYARDLLAVGPEGLGVLYAATAAGSLATAVTVSWLGEFRRAGLWILSGVTVYGVCVILFAGSRTFWLSVVLLGSAGAGDMLSTILRGAINQLSTPDELRGRMAAINSVFVMGGPHLGQFESGVVAAWLGAELSAMTGGLATLAMVAFVAAAFPAVRDYQLRQGQAGRSATVSSSDAT